MSRLNTCASFWTAVALAAALVLAAPRAAHAYVDPGSASMFFQILIGSLLGAAVAVRMYWTKLKALVRRGSRREQPDK